MGHASSPRDGGLACNAREPSGTRNACQVRNLDCIQGQRSLVLLAGSNVVRTLRRSIGVWAPRSMREGTNSHRGPVAPLDSLAHI